MFFVNKFVVRKHVRAELSRASLLLHSTARQPPLRMLAQWMLRWGRYSRLDGRRADNWFCINSLSFGGLAGQAGRRAGHLILNHQPILAEHNHIVTTMP